MAILLATLDLSSAEILRYYAYALVSARCLSPHWITTNARRGAAILYAHGRWFYYPAHPGTSPLRVAASKHVNLFWTDLLLTRSFTGVQLVRAPGVAVFCHSDYLSDNDLRQKVFVLHESAVYRGQFVEIRMQECMWDKLSNDIYNSCTSPMNNAPLRRALYIPGPGINLPGSQPLSPL